MLSTHHHSAATNIRPQHAWYDALVRDKSDAARDRLVAMCAAEAEGMRNADPIHPLLVFALFDALRDTERKLWSADKIKRNVFLPYLASDVKPAVNGQEAILDAAGEAFLTAYVKSIVAFGVGEDFLHNEEKREAWFDDLRTHCVIAARVVCEHLGLPVRIDSENDPTY